MSDSLAAYRGLSPYFGDIHNHCDISYGRGSLDDAYRNARMQLDFASVTGHAHWPDMPPEEGRLAYLVAYHKWGFEHLAEVWDEVQTRTEELHEDDRFVTFLSFEWHSMRHGDYCIYYKGSQGEIIRAPDIEAMRHELARVRATGGDAMMIPHHICYVPGFRGINWNDFDAEFSPVVEIVSMHGGAEDDGPRPYLHSMGPRDGRNSMLAGLRAGKVFGVIGSTDHHSAHPGSYDHGRMGVWAHELTRDGIWDAIRSRRTWALTGERIELAFALNDAPMGAIIEPANDCTLAADVRAGGTIDYVEIVKNGEAVARRDALGRTRPNGPAFRGKVMLSVGWGEQPHETEWEVRFGVEGGRVLGVEPRLHGGDFASPAEPMRTSYAISSWQRTGDNHVEMRTRTSKNPNTKTDCTQKMCLEIEGDGGTEIVARVNGRDVRLPLSELREGPRAGFLDGLVSEAWQLSRAVPESEYAWHCRWTDTVAADGDFYYVRVRQKNDQWAWSSPIFVRPRRPTGS